MNIEFSKLPTGTKANGIGLLLSKWTSAIAYSGRTHYAGTALTVAAWFVVVRIWFSRTEVEGE